MIRTALQEPGTTGTYDAQISLAGLGFSPRYLESFFEPVQENWRQLLAAYHEWVHHYQFHATTYGYLYRLISNSQLLLVNGTLRVAQADRRRLRLPLATRTVPLSASGGNPVDVNLSLISMLQAQRDGILGYGPHVAMSDLGEWRLACAVLDQMFGGPQTVVIDPSFLPSPPQIRYPVADLLETHAHALSSIWLMLAVDRAGGDRRITQATVAQANEHITGPYAAFAPFVPALRGSPQDRMRLFCALAETALNPPGIHRRPEQSWESMINPLYTSWFPVVRLETLMSLALDGHITWPTTGWPDMGRDFLRLVERALHQQGNTPGAFLPAPQSVALPALQRAVDRVSRYAAVDNDVPQELLAFQLDGLAKLCIAEELKQQAPLLLSGMVIEELKLLVNHLAGPTARCHYDGGSSTVIGACTGLMRLGLLSPGTVTAASDAIVNLGAPIAHALHLLLVRSRAELEGIADKPLLGLKEWTLRTVLAEHYAMALAGFD